MSTVSNRITFELETNDEIAVNSFSDEKDDAMLSVKNSSADDCDDANDGDVDVNDDDTDDDVDDGDNNDGEDATEDDDDADFDDDNESTMNDASDSIFSDMTFDDEFVIIVTVSCDEKLDVACFDSTVIGTISSASIFDELEPGEETASLAACGTIVDKIEAVSIVDAFVDVTVI